MASVIPLIVAALLFTGTIGALLLLWNSRLGSAASRTPGDLRVQAIARLVWALFLLFHAVVLLVMSESREVSQALSICASVGGALTFLAALVALLSCVSLERRAAKG